MRNNRSLRTVNVPVAVAAAIAVGVILLVGASLRARAEAGQNCKVYALAAAKQHKENEERSCGFKGPEWTKDIKAHLAWCQSVPPQEWRAMLKKRQEMLASCK